MRTNPGNSRFLWLIVGVIAGLGIAKFWPHEPLQAATSDRSAKFGMLTNSTGFAGLEGVFVLDYLTGQMTGAVIDQKSGKFLISYSRNVAKDFGVDPKSTPQYAFVGGRASIAGGRGVSPATGVIYVGELTSGMVIAYGMDYRILRKPVAKLFFKLDAFRFREAALK